MPRLFPPFSATDDTQHIIRTRKFQVRSLDDIPGVMALLKRERFVGSVTIHVGPGGTVNSIHSEEKAHINHNSA